MNHISLTILYIFKCLFLDDEKEHCYITRGEGDHLGSGSVHGSYLRGDGLLAAVQGHLLPPAAHRKTKKFINTL